MGGWVRGEVRARVVISGPFLKKLLHNHIIKKKSFSGDVNYEANFPLFFLFISNGPYTPPLPRYVSNVFGCPRSVQGV